jgi:predicted XRE-type DNA-binding protein
MASKAKNHTRIAQGVVSLQARAILAEKIRSLLAAGPWTQTEAASLCGLTQPRISDLRRGKPGRFSLDSLVNIAAALERHSPLRKGNTLESTDTEGQRLVAKFMAQLAERPVKGRYPVATEHSITERGGQVIAPSGISTPEGRVAFVGDTVRYQDGSQTRIVTGSGSASLGMEKAIALVGSLLENGDRITGPMHNGLVLTEDADQAIPGLFQLDPVIPTI